MKPFEDAMRYVDFVVANAYAYFKTERCLMKQKPKERMKNHRIIRFGLRLRL